MCVANEIDNDKIYSFDELPKDVQDEVIENLGISNSEDWRVEDVLDYWKEQLAENGFDNAEFDYCVGSYNGSDGVCFKASVNEKYYIEKFKKHLRKDRTKTYALRRRQKKLLEFAYENYLIAFAIYDKGYSRYIHYKHGRYVEFTGDENYNYADLLEDKTENDFQQICLEAIYGNKNEFVELMEEMKDFIEAERLEWCEKVYDSLYTDYEWQSSRECMTELIEANEYKFYRDGEIAI